MKELYLKHQTVIFRTLGALLLVIGFAAYFWTTPKEGLSANEKAAANVARMEAQAMGGSSAGGKPKSNESTIMKKYKETQAAQVRIVLILMMISGVGFLGYSFVRKKD